MTVTAAVAGASGYAGGELLRLLCAHPDVNLGPVAAHSAEGERVDVVHPALRSLAGRRFSATTPQVLGEADVVFLALPHGESAALATQLEGVRVVVDLGADFRLRDAATFTAAYGVEHAGSWPYGLPELPGQREKINGALRIANPGCYPTGTALALAPVLAAGLAEPQDLVVVAASGTSGAGRSAKTALLGAETMGDLTAYKVGTHQHRPEVVQTLSDAAGTPVSLSFTTVLAPMPRGILATCTARAVPGTTADDVRRALHDAYDAEPFVSVLDDDLWPHTAATAGSNAVHLQGTLDEQAGRIVVVAAFDNLGKGAAGQAVQNANLALGLSETAGLALDGVAP